MAQPLYLTVAQARKARRALERALKIGVDKYGTQTRLAALMGITSNAISQWYLAPPNRCRKLEQLTGVPRAELRPDFFGDHPELPMEEAAA